MDVLFAGMFSWLRTSIQESVMLNSWSPNEEIIEECFKILVLRKDARHTVMLEPTFTLDKQEWSFNLL